MLEDSVVESSESGDEQVLSNGGKNWHNDVGYDSYTSRICSMFKIRQKCKNDYMQISILHKDDAYVLIPYLQARLNEDARILIAFSMYLS